MNLLHVKNLKDCRNTLNKHVTKTYSKRSLADVSHIAVHHSATKTGSAESFARYHVNSLGWPGIGYHFVIEKIGKIKWTNDLNLKTYHVGNSNKKSIGICLTGDFREDDPSQPQWESLFNLLRTLIRELNIESENIWGHSQFPNYETKACPCLDMQMIRDKLKRKTHLTYSKKPNQVTLKPNQHLNSLLQRFSFLDYGKLRQLNPTISRPVSEKTTVRIKGEKEIIPKEVSKLINVFESKKYEVFRNGDKNFNLNIVGIRNSNSIPNKFDDNLIVFWQFENRWQIRKYKITTDPGLSYLNSPISEHGTAILKEGQYLDSYKIGKHRKKYKALIQAKPLTVIRDFNRDNKLDFTSGKQQTGFFGINIHRATASGSSTFVNKWSAGCQVFSNSNDYNDFINLCERASSIRDNSFTYTLINSNDLT